MRNPKSLRTLVCVLLALVAGLVLPSAASAGATQLSMMQDDAELFGDRGEDPAAAMKEMKELGVDVLRTNVLFYRIYDDYTDRSKPAGFDPSDPNSPQYTRWGPTDRIVALAKQHGIKLLFTISGPGPHWSSSQPGRCRGNRLCPWKPSPKVFGQFVEAVAKRYRGQVDWYSLYNEPNIGRSGSGTGWLMPQATRTKAGRVETAGVIYRKLWQAGYKSIAGHDPGRRGRVLFGEVAAIGEPLPKLYAALCLDRTGKPFKGRMRRAHGCGRVSKLKIGGWAIHPYNQGGFGPPNRKTNSKTALPQQYIPRLHRLMKQAARRGRVPAGRGIYITEFGYQTNPPDRISTISPKKHARYINESDRLFFGDPRVKTVSQYQLVDVMDVSQYNSGLRFAGGAKKQKASYAAFRLPIVVTRKSKRLVEVYGQVRPARQARLANAFSAPELQFAPRGRGFSTVRRPALNRVGIFRIDMRRAGAAAGRWRIKWQNGLIGGTSYSRVAKAGKPLRYYRN
jgi:hypothetical protein